MTDRFFAMVPTWVLRHAMSANAKVAYAGLAVRANRETHACWPSLETLAEETGLSRRKLQRAITELREVGALIVRKGSPEDHRSNTYILPPEPKPVQASLDGISLTTGGTHRKRSLTTGARGGRTGGTSIKEVEPEPLNEKELQKPSASERTSNNASKNARAEATSKNPGRTPDEPREAAGPGKSRQVVRVPDPAFNALAEATGMNPAELTRGARRQVAVALASIRTAAADLNGQLPDEIRLRAQRYARSHPDWALTPFALDKWWPTLGADGGSARTNRLARLVEAMDE